MAFQVLFNGQFAAVYLRTIFVANFNNFDHTFMYVQDLFIRLITQSRMLYFPWTNITFKSTKGLQYGEGFSFMNLC